MGATTGTGPLVGPVLQAALEWAAKGRRVFPLNPGEKTPAVRWQDDATTREDQLRAWFELAPPPYYGLGLPMGDGLAVIDVDVSRGGEINPAWPATLVAHTRSGGWHLYYRVDREVRNSVDRIASGVDVRGDGGYVVAPPTPGWKWANPGHEIAEIPFHMLVPARLSGATWREDWRPFMPAEDGVPEGTRNDYLARFAGWLIKSGLTDYDEYEDAVLRENERIVQPPVEDEEARATARSIWRYR